MKISVKKLIYTAAAAFALAAAVIVITNIKPVLVISDSSSGKIFAEFEFDYEDTFYVSFIHSVNQSEVIDFFMRGEKNKLICYKNKFHAFGAGMPESWPEDAVVETTKDGITVSNLHIELDNMTYIVGTVSDHLLVINDNEAISLRDLCGKNAEVLFELKYKFITGGLK